MHRLFLVLISLLATNAFAADVANLYQSQQPVLSQSEEERLKAAPELLQQVIVKVVADRSALALVDLSPLLAQAPQFIAQSQYHRINEISSDVTQPDQLEIELSFNKKAIDHALTELGLPIWSQSRPETIVWLAVDNKGQRSLTANDENTQLSNAFKSYADKRGLPILFPVMDLQEQSQVNFADITAGFSQVVEQASQRYASPIILMVDLHIDENDNVDINWHSRINGQSQQWTSTGDINAALHRGIDSLADRLAKQFSQYVASSSKEELFIHITNVRDYADYARVIDYLNNLQYVSEVYIAKVIDDSVDLKLLFNGDISVLDRILAIDKLLVDQRYSGVGELNYRFSP